MKKYTSFLLIITILLCSFMCGCNKDSESKDRTDYAVNNGGIINIGVIAPISEDDVVGNDIVTGVEFANSLAQSVNIDSTYLVNLCVYDLNDNIDDTAQKLINDKVAAVICAGTDFDKTNSVIKAFEQYSTPVIFTDLYSDSVSSSSTAYSLSVPYSYQNSVISAYLTSEGLVNGRVIYSDDSYSTAFAKAFESVFESAGGSVVLSNDTEYGNEDFVFVIGNNSFNKSVAEKIKTGNPDAKVILSEAYNKNAFESDKLQDICFISKFEVDVENNHIGTDFINMYSDMNDISESDVSSATAYGYDAYMLIYGVLAKCNPVTSVSGNSTQEDTTSEINVSRINESLKDIIHYGVTDTISFNKDGLVETKFIYLDKVENSNASMLNKYVY